MKRFLYLYLFFTTSLYSFPDLSTFTQESPIIRNGKLFYIHQYQLDVAFGRVNDYLCLFRNTDYKNFSNLEDGMGYKAILDNNACQNGEVNLPWLVVSKQATSADNLVMEMSMPNTVVDPRIKLILEEETSDANPYGVLTLDYQYSSMGLGGLNRPFYNATYESSILPNNQVQFETAVYIDGVVLNNTVAPGTEVYFYTSKTLHNQNSGGYGTVTERIFLTLQDSPFEQISPNFFLNGYTKNYPDGNPYSISTTNFAYNDNVVKYEITYGYTGTKNLIGVESGGNVVLQESSAGTELCVERSASWTYVPAKRYGVYNSEGVRIAFSTENLNEALTADYDYATTNTLWNGKVKIFSGGWLGTALQCKKIADGSFYGDGLCPGTIIGDVSSVILIDNNYYQNFPLFDVPEGTILTIDESGGAEYSGEEFYIRQLGVSKVYPARSLGDAECASLTIQPSLDTPDHTFHNYPVVSTPRTGAILVNKLNATTDIFAGGIVYSKDGDADEDGVLNYLDAFPENPGKSLDADHDLIADIEDEAVTIFQPDLTEYKNLDKFLYSNYLD